MHDSICSALKGPIQRALKIHVSPQFRAIGPPNPARRFIQQMKLRLTRQRRAFKKFDKYVWLQRRVQKCMKHVRHICGRAPTKWWKGCFGAWNFFGSLQFWTSDDYEATKKLLRRVKNLRPTMSPAAPRRTYIPGSKNISFKTEQLSKGGLSQLFSQQPFSAAFLSRLSRQPFSAAFLSSSSSAFLSSRPQLSSRCGEGLAVRSWWSATYII